MSGCDLEAVESLAFGELAPARAEAVRAHVAACPACSRELALLRRERGVFAERARTSAAAPAPGFAAALARSRWVATPAVATPAVAAKPPPPAAVAKARFPWATSAFGVAAAAAFAAILLVPPTAKTRLDPPPSEPIVAEPASEDFCHDEAFSTGVTRAPRSPVVCEMPEPTAAAVEHGTCAEAKIENELENENEEIVTCDHEAPVTEACGEPLPN